MVYYHCKNERYHSGNYIYHHSIRMIDIIILRYRRLIAADAGRGAQCTRVLLPGAVAETRCHIGGSRAVRGQGGGSQLQYAHGRGPAGLQALRNIRSGDQRDWRGCLAAQDGHRIFGRKRLVLWIVLSCFVLICVLCVDVSLVRILDRKCIMSVG